MQYPRHQRAAFTMVEVVFVIAVLGIVASMSAEIIARLYSGYVYQRAVHRASIKTELAALQIVNRLEAAIPGTLIAREDLGANIDNFIPLDEITAGESEYRVLQWVGADMDSFNAMKKNANTGAKRRPGWSGFVDVDKFAPNKKKFSTPGSRLSLTNTIIQNLSAGTNPQTIANAALFFVGDNTYNEHNIGYKEANMSTNGVFPISKKYNQVFKINNGPTGSKRFSELYKLAWTSYAIEATLPDGDGNFDLILHYNFQPWNGVTIDQAAGSEVLVRNVSVFRFESTADTVRFKICQREQVLTGEFVAICKEKAVIR